MVADIQNLARSVSVGQTPDQILESAVALAHASLGVDSTFAAVNDGSNAFPMRFTDGIRDPRFLEINIRPGLGLGGRTLMLGMPLYVWDYAADTSITQDFVHVVSDIEGLRSMACVPIVACGRTEALLYTAEHDSGAPGDLAVHALQMVASSAQLALEGLQAHQRDIEIALLRERQRLAIELHDSVAQMLFDIGVAAHYSRREQDPEALSCVLSEIESTASSARQKLRETLQHLVHSPAGLAFEARLEGEVRLAERTTGCRVTITRRGDPYELPEPLETLIIDTLVEGLRNAAKHGCAKMAVAHLHYARESITLTIQADGSHGGDSTWPGAGTGAGLMLLAARAEQLRGTIETTTDHREACVLRLELPVRVPLTPSDPTRFGSPRAAAATPENWTPDGFRVSRSDGG